MDTKAIMDLASYSRSSALRSLATNHNLGGCPGIGAKERELNLKLASANQQLRSSLNVINELGNQAKRRRTLQILAHRGSALRMQNQVFNRVMRSDFLKKYHAKKAALRFASKKKQLCRK